VTCPNSGRGARLDQRLAPQAGLADRVRSGHAIGGRRRLFSGFCLMVVWALLAGLSHARADDLEAREARYYRIITIPIPKGIMLEAGALQMMPNGELAVSTRIGDVWMLENPLADPPTRVKFHLYASGLHEVLGLAYHDGWLYAIQRPEVTRMRDLNGDGRADVFQTVCDDWSINGNYHEYAFMSKFDPEGYLWVTLTLTGSFTSDDPWRGWCVRVSPDGRMIPTCSGLRSPGGIGTNCLGDMFYTDNQGTWNGADALKQLVPGAFEGNPEGNKWYPLARKYMGPRPPDPVSGGRLYDEAKRIPQLVLPAVYFPYPVMGQSASGFVCDSSGGKFGPFAGQLLVGDQSHSTLMRVSLEKVNGHYQGACYMLRNGFASGNLSLEMERDGSLFVYGTDRGWGARGGHPFALQRVVWTGQVPFEVREMRAAPDGFELEFTRPVDPAAAGQPSSYTLETYTYIYQSSYGSPEVDRTKPVIRRATVSADRSRVHLVVDGLVPGHVHELHLPGVRSATGEPLLHDAAYYTLNFIPKR
jgi:glucose/arabinose dehydrogenase